MELAEKVLALSGDLYHFRISRDQRRVPQFNVNRERSLAAMAKVEALVETQERTFDKHAAALFETLTLAPGYQ